MCKRIRWTHKLVKELFEKRSYTLLTLLYKNTHEKLDYICPEGHKHNISFNKFKYGGGCPYCSKKIKKSQSYVSKLFSTYGYTTDASLYTNTSLITFYLNYLKKFHHLIQIFLILLHHKTFFPPYFNCQSSYFN